MQSYKQVFEAGKKVFLPGGVEFHLLQCKHPISVTFFNPGVVESASEVVEGFSVRYPVAFSKVEIISFVNQEIHVGISSGHVTFGERNDWAIESLKNHAFWGSGLQSPVVGEYSIIIFSNPTGSNRIAVIDSAAVSSGNGTGGFYAGRYTGSTASFSTFRDSCKKYGGTPECVILKHTATDLNLIADKAFGGMINGSRMPCNIIEGSPFICPEGECLVVAQGGVNKETKVDFSWREY